MIPDPLRLAIALIPLASYCALLGLVNARRRPFLTTGGCDFATLGAALSGLVLVGPIELFRPEAASTEYGAAVWIFLLASYWLWLWLAVLLSRPRLEIFNISGEELRPLLAEAARAIDPQARWAGDGLALPSLGVQLHFDVFEALRHASLISSGGKQSIDGWRQLHAELRVRLKQLPVRPNPATVGFLVTGLLLIGGSIAGLVASPVQVAQAIHEMSSF